MSCKRTLLYVLERVVVVCGRVCTVDFFGCVESVSGSVLRVFIGCGGSPVVSESRLPRSLQIPGLGLLVVGIVALDLVPWADLLEQIES